MSDTQVRPQSDPQHQPALLPKVDVYEDDTGLTLLADLPGVSREQVTLRVDGDTLTIEGAVAADLPESLRAVHVEVPAARYRRTFTLSRELDAARIEAESRDGVLRLRIPKLAHAQPRKIAVQVH